MRQAIDVLSKLRESPFRGFGFSLGLGLCVALAPIVRPEVGYFRPSGVAVLTDHVVPGIFVIGVGLITARYRQLSALGAAAYVGIGAWGAAVHAEIGALLPVDPVSVVVHTGPALAVATWGVLQLANYLTTAGV